MDVPPPRTIVFAIGGSVSRADVPALCERVRALLEWSDADVALCDVGALVDPDVGTVEALARLQLTAQRLGREVHLYQASAELQELLALVGLAGVVQVLRLEPERQAEEREEGLGVEERGELDDLTG